MKPRVFEPTSPAKPQTRGRGDTPPPAPPHELPRGELPELHFEAGERAWIARLAGRGACGTGSYGLGLVDAVHFFTAEEPERPRREALLARGRFEDLFPEELRALLAGATEIRLPRD